MHTRKYRRIKNIFLRDQSREESGINSGSALQKHAVKKPVALLLNKVKLPCQSPGAPGISPCLLRDGFLQSTRCHHSARQRTWIYFISSRSGETSRCQQSQAGQRSQETAPFSPPARHGPGAQPNTRPIYSAPSQIRSDARCARV